MTPPHSENPKTPYRGYILNLYVEASYRNQRLAQTLLKQSDEEFARRNIYFVILHPTLKAKPLYQRLGWTASGEMVKHIQNDLAFIPILNRG